MFNLYNTPGASLLLSIGKFNYYNKYLFLSCVLTLTLSVFAVQAIGVGGVVIGYGFHTFFMMIVFFTKIYKKDFRVSPLNIFYILLKYYLSAFIISVFVFYVFYNRCIWNIRHRYVVHHIRDILCRNDQSSSIIDNSGGKDHQWNTRHDEKKYKGNADRCKFKPI